MKRNLLLVIAAAIPLTLGAQLNPTVKVLSRPASPVPPECDQGLAPQQAQRVTPEERTSVRDTKADMQAPPSADLRGELHTALFAAQHNNRDVFREALSRSRDVLDSYPPGAERNAATELMTVLNDIDTVWSFQFSSPTGAFFDASSDSFRVASRYPGYDTYIRRQVIVDQNGSKFYPTSETLDFLAGEAASRLARLTGRPAPPKPAMRGSTLTPPTAPSQRRPTFKTTTTTTTKPSAKTTTTKAALKATAAKPHVTRHAPSTRHVARTTTPTKVVAKKTSPPPPVAKTESVAAPAAAQVAAVKPAAAPKATPLAPTAIAKSAGETSAASSSVAAPTITTPTDTMSSAPATTTEATSATEPASTTEPSATSSTESTGGAKPAQTRSFFWPIFLIIVGLGVLVMLWRASS